MIPQHLLIFCLLCAVTIADSTRKINPYRKRQQSKTVSQECHLLVPTDVWTTCSDVLSTYHISLSDFVKGNTGLAQDCGGFAPGKPYCVALAIEHPLMMSNDSRCGAQENWTNTCVGSTYGDCWYDNLSSEMPYLLRAAYLVRGQEDKCRASSKTPRKSMLIAV